MQLQLQQSPVSPPTWGPHPDKPTARLHRCTELNSLRIPRLALISVKQLTGKQLTGAGGELKQLRAQLGNDLAIKAFRDGTLPFPDGAIIAALHWNEVLSDVDNQALGTGFPGLGLESSFAGSAVNVQFMVKD